MDNPGSKATGHLKSSSGLTSNIGIIKTIVFNGCVGPAGQPSNLTYTLAAGALPWKFHALTYDSSTGTTIGTITGIHAKFTGTNNTCTATIDGTGANNDNGKVRFKHANSTPTKLRVLQKGDNLHVFRVSGYCASHGYLESGDAIVLATTYTLNEAQTISSP